MGYDDAARSHYEVLGVDGRTASVDDIKRAYKSRVRTHAHRDFSWLGTLLYVSPISGSLNGISVLGFMRRCLRSTRTSKAGAWMHLCACRGRGRRGSSRTHYC